MKKFLLTLALPALTFFLTQCSSDSTDEEMQDPAVVAQAVTDLAVSGTWVVSSYIDSGTDETDDYNGYTFTFNADGSLVADNGSSTVTGTWSVTVDDSSDDDDYDSMDDVDFNIFFAAPPIFEELTDDWDIVSRSSTRIELIDISGGDGSTDTLVFEKN
ncbi:hypothetical protein [Muriicola sp.]|uniref:hypothetical protein n=2 Tax=Muriicola sp. TaxID=2020856 RepID=UPI0035630290